MTTNPKVVSGRELISIQLTNSHLFLPIYCWHISVKVNRGFECRKINGKAKGKPRLWVPWAEEVVLPSQRSPVSHADTIKGHQHTQQLILKSHNWRHFALQGCQSNCLLTRWKTRVNCTGTQPNIFFTFPLILNTSNSPHYSLSEEYDPSESILRGNLNTSANFYEWNISPWHHQYDSELPLSILKYKYLS